MSSSAKPRYQQLKELIIERISSGELQPRDRVPSEHELVDTTGVSRMTANRALRELNDEGIVERVVGKGTFVADLKAESHLLEVRNIADEIRHRGHRHSARVLMLETRAVTAEIAKLLHVQDGVARAIVVHCENDVPIQVEDRYVVDDFAPGFLEQDFSVVTPSAYLNGISPLQEAEHVVRAAMPDVRMRRHLGMPEGEPCLVVTRRTWAHGRPVSFARLHHPGSRFELTGQFSLPAAHPANRQADSQTDMPIADIVELRNRE